MRPSSQHSSTLLRRGPLACAALLISAVCFSHGTAVSPSSRVYRVYQANPSNPSFQLAANAVAIDGELSYYTWNEVSRNIPDAVTAGLPPGFDYSPWIPDGQLASAGRVDPFSTEYPRTYAGLDQVSADWPKQAVDGGGSVAMDFLATAVHHPSVWDVWMTRPSWNPSMPLTWDQMEFLGRPTPAQSGNNFLWDQAIPRDRSGHHVLWIAWQRDDPVGEVFLSTSDLEVLPAPPLYPGTIDDLQLATGANGYLSSASPEDEKTAAVGDLWTVELTSPLGTFHGDVMAVLARPLASGQTLSPLFGTPDVYLNPAQATAILAGNLSAGGDSWSITLPTSAAGKTIAFQGGVFSMWAQNGSYAATDVHLLHID